MDYTILVGGAAGQGLDTFASIMEKILKRCGFHVFTYRDYMSRVRGGHNYTQIRFSDKEIYSFKNKIDVLLALNKEAFILHKDRLKEDGIVISHEEFPEKRLIKLPLEKIKRKLKNYKALNMVGLGAIIKYFGVPLNIAEELLEESFGEEYLEDNKQALMEGYVLLDTRYELPKEKMKI